MGDARLLLIENSRAKRDSFADALKKRYQVMTVPSGKQAIAKAAQYPPAVIVLDAISMRTPGDRITRALQEKLPHIPLIHLRPETAEAPDSEADVVLTPSFTARKLVNSIERVLNINHADATDDEMIVCDCFSMSPRRRVLLVNGQEKSLTPKQAALVEFFFRNPGVTLARETLMKQVWDTNYMGDTRTLDVHIRWIRRAIEADPSRPRYLKTVRGVGYRLDVPDEPEPILQPETVLAVS